jgi:4-amino-4-deoxy-L-arabinose transferase-like glycosyltransferase
VRTGDVSGTAEDTKSTLALAAVLTIGAGLRVVDLGSLPGINGDEAWYGVNVEMFRSGQPFFLQTGVGNPLNPLHSLPLLLFSYLSPPSLPVLRLPSALWGILAMLLAYPLLGRPLGSRAARWTAMLVALSPALVAYARLGWDPSDTPLVVLLAVSFAIRDQPGLALVTCAASFLVHPTNVFGLPIVAAAWGPHGIARYQRLDDRAKRRLHIGVIALGLIAAPTVLWVLARSAENPNTVLPSVEIVFERVTSVSGWLEVILGMFALFSGVTTGIFIGGPVSSSLWTVAVAGAMLALVVAPIAGWDRFHSNHRSVGPWLAAGIAVSLALVYVVGGPVAVQPAHERYVMFLLVPLAMLCAIGLDAVEASRPRWGLLGMGAVCVGLFTTLLATYVQPLMARGSDSEVAFRTGSVEPKLAAYEYVQRDSARARVVRIVAEDWWLYWPLRYLAARDPRMHVELKPGAAAPGGLRPAGADAPVYPTPDNDYAVVWGSGDGAIGERAVAFTATDPLRRPILSVLRRSHR